MLKDNQALPTREDSSESEDGSKKITWRRRDKVSLNTQMTEPSDDDDNQNYADNDDEYEVHVPTKNQSIQSQSKPPEDTAFVFANVDTVPPKRDSDDPDKLFLLSLLPHLKSIPEGYRLSVKMELMKILQNANYNSVYDQKLL